MREIDVRGLSCPEPVMQVNMALKAFPGEELKILLSEAHSYKNVVEFLKDKKVPMEAKEVGLDFEVIIRP
ncbi:MAG TPA: sulfurtransferase TusA family protein [Clostridia bacterium]|jgi:TusA-related sulfurtransferase|nr:sulfurtransferase TusA family protein [Clostridia bacterium]